MPPAAPRSPARYGWPASVATQGESVQDVPTAEAGRVRGRARAWSGQRAARSPLASQAATRLPRPRGTVLCEATKRGGSWPLAHVPEARVVGGPHRKLENEQAQDEYANRQYEEREQRLERRVHDTSPLVLVRVPDWRMRGTVSKFARLGGSAGSNVVAARGAPPSHSPRRERTCKRCSFKSPIFQIAGIARTAWTGRSQPGENSAEWAAIQARFGEKGFRL